MTPENDWIEWAGGECPVPGDTLVNLKTADNDPSWMDEDHRADTFEGRPNWWTGVGCEEWRIVAYRIVSPTLPAVLS